MTKEKVVVKLESSYTGKGFNDEPERFTRGINLRFESYERARMFADLFLEAGTLPTYDGECDIENTARIEVMFE